MTRPGRSAWIANHYAIAPDQPGGSRHVDLARQLVRRGWDVTIFAAGFHHGTQREERLGRFQLYRVDRYDGVRFVWLRTFPYRGNTWRRQVNMASYLAVFLVVQTRFAAPEAIVGSTVHPFAALAGWIAARLRGARFVFEIRDLWPQTLVDLGAMREGSPGERLLRGIEALLVRRASAVITLLPGMRDYLASRGLPTSRVVYVPNGVDLGTFDAAVADGALPDAVTGALQVVDSMRRQGRLVVGYIGVFGRVNRLDVVTRAAEIAEARSPGRLGVVFVGDGPERGELDRAARSCDAVAVASSIPKRLVPVVLRAMDGLVVHATSTPVYRYGISFNKLFEYMAAARPVVFACDSAYDPVASERAGLSIPPDDAELLADALLRLADLPPEERARMGAAGREFVCREHNMDALGETLAAALTGESARPGDA